MWNNLKKHHQKSKQKPKSQHQNRSRSQPQKPRDDTQSQSEQSHYKCRGCGKTPHKITENNAQHGDISARSVRDTITMSQYVEKYQSILQNKNTQL